MSNVRTTPALSERLMATLFPVFGRVPTFYSDSSELTRWLSSIGCRAVEFAQAHAVPKEYHEAAVAITADYEKIPPFEEWHALFQDSQVLIVPLSSFDSSMDSAIYMIEMLAKSTFEESARLNESWLSLLVDRQEPLVLAGQGCDLVCELEDDVTVLKPKLESSLMPGEWESIGAFFEVGMIATPEDFRPGLRPGYVVNGVLSVPGVAVAHHRHMHPDLRPMAVQAWDLLHRVQKEDLFPLRMEIDNSRAVHVWAGTEDLSKTLEELTNKRLELVLCEVAFSTNEGMIPKHLDWSKNSQLNEGAIGIHVGLGDGVSGAHIDFICPGVELLN